ncbi:hypothetical protein RI054_21g93610 [Pseudoscourfieldia marina]
MLSTSQSPQLPFVKTPMAVVLSQKISIGLREENARDAAASSRVGGIREDGSLPTNQGGNEVDLTIVKEVRRGEKGMEEAEPRSGCNRKSIRLLGSVMTNPQGHENNTASTAPWGDAIVDTLKKTGEGEGTKKKADAVAEMAGEDATGILKETTQQARIEQEILSVYCAMYNTSVNRRMIGTPSQLVAFHNMGRGSEKLSYPSIGKQTKWTAFYTSLEGESDAKSADKVSELSPLQQATVFGRKLYTIVVAWAGVFTPNMEAEYEGSEHGCAPGNKVTYHVTEGAYKMLMEVITAMMRAGISKEAAFQRLTDADTLMAVRTRGEGGAKPHTVASAMVWVREWIRALPRAEPRSPHRGGGGGGGGGGGQRANDKEKARRRKNEKEKGKRKAEEKEEEEEEEEEKPPPEEGKKDGGPSTRAAKKKTKK